MDYLDAETASKHNMYHDEIMKIVHEYRRFNKTDSWVIGAMAFTILMYRLKVKRLENKNGKQ